MKRIAPAAERNRAPIAGVLSRWLPARGLVLEVASGTGEHAVHFARRFPDLTWQPSDPDESARDSIAAWRDEASLANLRPPLALDAAASPWPVDRVDAVVCINMVHISPWAASVGLVAGAARLLAPSAPLVLYGPYRQAGAPTAPGNEAFDAGLKAQNPAWGLRSVEQISALAAASFHLEEVAPMPADNLMLLFRKKSGPEA